MIRSLIIVAFFIMAFTTSCATLFTGTKQTVTIDTKPQKAKIQVNGIKRGETPAAIKLKKSNDGQTVTLIKKGYEKKISRPMTDFQPVSVLNLGNLLFWGIDAATGALWKYSPERYELELKPKGKD